MVLPSGKPPQDSLYVRPVVEEFKAFVQHKIEVLERFRNVDEIKVYLDALELGVQAILDLQMEDADDLPAQAEVEFKGLDHRSDAAAAESADATDEALIEEETASAPPLEEPEEGPGIETEELETREDPGSPPGIEGNLPEKEDEVLVGEEKPLVTGEEGQAPETGEQGGGILKSSWEESDKPEETPKNWDEASKDTAILKDGEGGAEQGGEPE